MPSYRVERLRTLGRAYVETDEAELAKRPWSKTLSGQYSRPVRVVAFSTAEARRVMSPRTLPAPCGARRVANIVNREIRAGVFGAGIRSGCDRGPVSAGRLERGMPPLVAARLPGKANRPRADPSCALSGPPSSVDYRCPIATAAAGEVTRSSNPCTGVWRVSNNQVGSLS